jgi:SPOR domain
VSDDLSIPSPTYRIPRHRRGMDPLTKRLALISFGLGGALIVVVGGWSMLNHQRAAIPVVQAEGGPIRVKPANPGGMQIAGAGDDILSGSSKSGDDKLGPAPETPDPQALRAPPPSAPPLAATAPVATAAAVAPAPVAAVAANPVATKPIAPLEKREAAAAAPVADHAQPTGKDTFVQLAAVRSEADAKSEWDRLSKRMPDLLGQHRPAISKIDRDGHTLWRVRTGGFTDVTQAKDFCERVRAKGSGCSVADF